MNKPIDCCLNLVCHKSLEERMIDHLLEHPQWVSGFTVDAVDGHSVDEHLPSMLEQVRGRSQRVEIRCVMNRDDAQELLEYLRKQEHNADIAYWVTPVLEFGRLE